MDRRSFVRAAVMGTGALAVGPGAFARVAEAQCPAAGPYGALRGEDAHGIRLPPGFVARVLARSFSRVAGTGYRWPMYPDGGATFPLAGGGWAYVANSEVPFALGGASSISFDAAGRVTGARRILGGTSSNCAGGATPWGTWLSCEEVERGHVHECDVLANRPTRRPALGRFKHEAAAVDADRRVVYLTEDEGDGCFYRFRYDNPADLGAGTLEVASVAGPDGGAVTWLAVPDPSGASTRTRNQVAAATRFRGGEGLWYADGVVHFTTKGDNRVWRYHVATATLSIRYSPATSCNPVLSGVDNIVVSRSGDAFVCEDGSDMQLVILGGDGSVSPFLQVVGQDGSELTGPAFSPDGSRLYLSSQRGDGFGITYEVRGPFR